MGVLKFASSDMYPMVPMKVDTRMMSRKCMMLRVRPVSLVICGGSSERLVADSCVVVMEVWAAGHGAKGHYQLCMEHKGHCLSRIGATHWS